MSHILALIFCGDWEAESHPEKKGKLQRMYCTKKGKVTRWTNWSRAFSSPLSSLSIFLAKQCTSVSLSSPFSFPFFSGKRERGGIIFLAVGNTPSLSTIHFCPVVKKEKNRKNWESDDRRPSTHAPFIGDLGGGEGGKRKLRKKGGNMFSFLFSVLPFIHLLAPSAWPYRVVNKRAFCFLRFSCFYRIFSEHPVANETSEKDRGKLP